jgi:hypothetical protein
MADMNDVHPKTHWHRLLAQAVEVPLTAANIIVQTEVDVTSGSPRADIILLRREGTSWTKKQKAWLTDGMRDTTAGELLIEFKFTESLTSGIFKQLLVYDHLYQEKRQLERHDLKSFLLLSKTPNTDILERHGFTPTNKTGFYTSSLEVFDSLYVILLNELPDLPHNALWKCFASREQEWKKAFECVDQYGLSKTSIQHEYIMFAIRRIRMDGAMENVEPIGLTPEYVMDLGRREWLASMMGSMPREELLKMPVAADIQQKGELKGELKGEAKLLVRLLTRRFGELSAAVHKQIADADSDTLERWGDLVLDARSLEDVFGPDTSGTH